MRHFFNDRLVTVLYILDLVNVNVLSHLTTHIWSEKNVLKTDTFLFPDDSWLGDGDADRMGDFGNERIYSSGTDRVYSGRGSPEKEYNPRSSAEMRARTSAFSASTTDSFDYAFQRDPRNRQAQNDDFFGT